MKRRDRDAIETVIENLDGIDQLRRLFWDYLNYTRINETLRPRNWDSQISRYPLLFAGAGILEAFHVLYMHMTEDNFNLTNERKIIEKLLSGHPYALFIFSDEAQEQWHFVNVKVVSTQQEENEKPEKRRVFRRISITRGDKRLHTVKQCLLGIDLDDESETLTPLEIQQKHDEAFDVEAVTKEFFREYRRVFENAERSITGIEDEEARRLFTQKLFNRLMFIIFLEKKGWLTFNDSQDYILSLWKDYRDKREQAIDHNFYNDRLKVLFFTGLNNPEERDIMGAAGRSSYLQERIGDVPYLNGGLFERSEYDEEDSTIVVPDDALRVAINDIFYRFNFTVVESTPIDVEVAVDPEMLGKIFEELVTGRHETGSYYTPKPIVSFMGREALKGYLQTACPDEDHEAIAQFVDEQLPDDIRDPEKVLEALKTVTICDPACGSGAYLVGMLHELVDLRLALFHRKEIDAITGYERRLEIIQNNIYGVDIDPFAVNIARLRLWLSLIVEFEGRKPLPLPNLDFKIEVGNSLTAPDPSGGSQPDLFRAQTVRRFNDLKNEYLVTHDRSKKLQIRDDIAKVRNEIENLARLDKSYIEGFDWAIEFAEIFLNGGFDILVANPPYVRIQSLSEDEVETLSAMYKSATANYDLYITFVERGLQLLAPNGIQSYILPHKFFNAKYGKNLRTLISQGKHLQSIIHFGHEQIFDGVTTYTCILTLSKSSKEHFTFTQVNNVQLWMDNRAGEKLLLDALAPSGQPWLFLALASPTFQSLKTNRQTLQDITQRIFQGLKTSADKIYIVQELERTEANVKIYSSHSDTEYWLETDLLHPLIKGGDSSAFYLATTDLLILFPYGSVSDGEPIRLIPAEYMEEHLPLTWKYLLENKTYLENRERGKMIGEKWYGYVYPKSLDVISNPKIFTPDIAPVPRYSLDEDGSVFFTGGTAGGYGIIPNEDVDIKYLLGLLNSRALQYYLQHISTPMRGGWYSYEAKYIKNLPIPDAPDDLHQQIADIAQQCLDAARGASGEVSTMLEDELNRLVYQAYGLNEDDIAAIEEYLDGKDK